MKLSGVCVCVGGWGHSVKGTSGGSWPTPLAYRQALGNLSTIFHPTAMFAAAVIAQDMMVGAVLDELERAGTLNDTVVLFSGDNGPDDHSLVTFDDVGPFRGRKRSLHEGGIRQTVVVQWPAVIQPGVVSTHLFSFYDFLPTALDLAGISPQKWPETDGISVLPTLLSAGRRAPSSSSSADVQLLPKQATHEFLYWEYHRRVISIRAGILNWLRFTYDLLRFLHFSACLIIYLPEQVLLLQERERATAAAVPGRLGAGLEV
jgi:hypothetical protein